MALQDFPDDFQALASIDWGTQLDDAQVADGVVRIKFLPGEGRGGEQQKKRGREGQARSAEANAGRKERKLAHGILRRKRAGGGES